MELASFSIQKYRSIKTAEKVSLGPLTVLIGPNNEGKSNILTGLVSGMRMLGRLHSYPSQSRRKGNTFPIRYFRREFRWDRDFPIDLQERTPGGRTILDFELQLTDEEVADFKAEVKSNLNGKLPVRLSLGSDQLTFEVRKKGPGGPALSAKHQQIARFVSRRINVRDIPAIRGAEQAVELVDEMVENELATLESSDEYRTAVEAIAALQAPVLDQIGQNVASMMKEFMPRVKSVRIELPDQYEALRENSRILVDDGAETELTQKGDGIQSLTAVALIHHVAKSRSRGRELVLAVEEPESHLHSSAIHQLRDVLADIATSQQVVITTHSPLLVNRADVASNVIVDGNKARPAQSIAQIRAILGVRVSDNLSNAGLVLLVEGETDRRSLLAVLSDRSSMLQDALTEGALAIDSLNGSNNLCYKFGSLKSQICAAQAFMDRDAAGIAAVKKAIDEGLAEPADVGYATHPSLNESELEDLWDTHVYAAVLKNRWNVDLAATKFSKTKKKWSVRMGAAFVASGQHWDDEICKEVKIAVCTQIARAGESALIPQLAGPIDALVAALEAKLISAG